MSPRNDVLGSLDSGNDSGTEPSNHYVFRPNGTKPLALAKEGAVISTKSQVSRGLRDLACFQVFPSCLCSVLMYLKFIKAKSNDENVDINRINEMKL